MSLLITSPENMAELVREYGMMPLLRWDIAGFSIDDYTPREYWFSDERDGPWEWKGPVIQMTGAVYGKFFRGKAGYIMPELFYDFANYRRDGYDFDARYDDGLVPRKDKEVYDLLDERGSMLSGDLRQLGGFGKNKKGGFESIVTRLQMQCYFITTNFEYRTDKTGKRYGWGVARLSTPEKYLGQSFSDNVYRHTPEESKEIILDHLKKILPKAGEKELLKIISR